MCLEFKLRSAVFLRCGAVFCETYTVFVLLCSDGGMRSGKNSIYTVLMIVVVVVVVVFVFGI